MKSKDAQFNNLTFIEYNAADSEKLALWISGETWPFHGTARPSIDKVRGWIDGGHFTGDDNKTFWIHLENQDDPIGLVSLHDFADITPVFDLRLKESLRNRGLGRKILDWLADYVFTKSDKPRLEGHTRADNLAMRRVFKACGWVMEAYHRQAWPDSSGKLHDAVTCTILKRDWETGVTTTIDWNREI